MAEKIAFVSWDFIELICSDHQKPLVLELRRQTPVYVCQTEDCLTQIPAVVYEKVLADIIQKLNNNCLTLGEIWRKKYAGYSYEFKVVTFIFGKKTRISVRNMR